MNVRAWTSTVCSLSFWLQNLFFPHPRIYRFKLWKTVLSPTLQSEKWYRLKIPLELWELGEWAAFTNSWITTIWESLILNEVLENGKANSLVIFLEEFLSSLRGPDRTPTIPHIPRLCITGIKYHVLNQARWDTQVLLMDKCAEMVGIERLSTIVKLFWGAGDREVSFFLLKTWKVKNLDVWQNLQWTAVAPDALWEQAPGTPLPPAFHSLQRHRCRGNHSASISPTKRKTPSCGWRLSSGCLSLCPDS